MLNRVTVSKPLTFPKTVTFPRNYYVLNSEAIMSWKFNTKLKTKYSDIILRIYLAIKFIFRYHSTDIFITGRYGEYFALIQSFFPKFKKPHLLLDVEWYGSGKSKILNNVRGLKQKCIVNGAYRVGVFCEVESKNYSKYYNVSEEKFIWIPYCTNINILDYDTRESNYIFTGGIHHRDFKTLYLAVKNLEIEIRICAPINSIPKKYISDNMNILGYLPHNEYFKQLARSKFVVLSLVQDIRRCPGVITYVSAMKLGKAVVVNEMEGSKSYINNGVTGVIVPPSNPSALQEAILTLVSDHNFRTNIADNALFHANSNFSQERLVRDIDNIVKSIKTA